jgi:hypothetical protein
MRELTKSTLSAGLAMSLFGMQTMMNMFRRPQPGRANSAQTGMDAVTSAILDQSGQTMRDVFQAGDKIQREMVDVTFAFMTLAPLRPSGAASSLGGMAQQATGLLSRLMGGTASGCGSCRGANRSSNPWSSAGPTREPSGAQPSMTSNQAWGPMPDAS